MITHYYVPRLPYRLPTENANKAKKRRTRDLLKLAEKGCPIFGASPVFPYDPNDWQGEKAARASAQAKADEFSKKAGVPVIVISREIAMDIAKAKKKGAQ